MQMEQIYEYTVRLTGMTDFGVPMDEVMAGQRPVPPAGLRADLAFEGQAKGRLAGAIEGVDYFYLRPDGRMELDIRAVLTTPDGARIALQAGGVGLPRPGEPVIALRENVKLFTGDERYAWVNPLEIWAEGEANMDRREVTLRGFIAK